MKKIIVISTSLRTGSNSDMLADQFIEGARAAGHEVTTLEGLQEKARPLAEFIADQGAEQCGFCNPGFMMNTIALLEENKDPSDDEIRAFLSGNLCRCSGYEGQLRGIRNYINYCKENGKEVLG